MDGMGDDRPGAASAGAGGINEEDDAAERRRMMALLADIDDGDDDEDRRSGTETPDFFADADPVAAGDDDDGSPAESPEVRAAEEDAPPESDRGPENKRRPARSAKQRPGTRLAAPPRRPAPARVPPPKDPVPVFRARPAPNAPPPPATVSSFAHKTHDLIQALRQLTEKSENLEAELQQLSAENIILRRVLATVAESVTDGDVLLDVLEAQDVVLTEADSMRDISDPGMSSLRLALINMARNVAINRDFDVRAQLPTTPLFLERTNGPENVPATSLRGGVQPIIPPQLAHLLSAVPRETRAQLEPQVRNMCCALPFHRNRDAAAQIVAIANSGNVEEASVMINRPETAPVVLAVTQQPSAELKCEEAKPARTQRQTSARAKLPARTPRPRTPAAVRTALFRTVKDPRPSRVNGKGVQQVFLDARKPRASAGSEPHPVNLSVYPTSAGAGKPSPHSPLPRPKGTTTPWGPGRFGSSTGECHSQCTLETLRAHLDLYSRALQECVTTLAEEQRKTRLWQRRYAAEKIKTFQQEALNQQPSCCRSPAVRARQRHHLEEAPLDYRLLRGLALLSDAQPQNAALAAATNPARQPKAKRRSEMTCPKVQTPKPFDELRSR